MIIRNVELIDAKAISDIYNYYVTDTIITFEQEPFSESDIAKKITEITEKGFPYIVYEENQKVIGYAYLNNWRTRRAYDITLETSIYLKKENMGRGIGEILYKSLIEKAKDKDIHSLIGVVSLPNEPSQRLHSKLGFELAGKFREAGRKFNKYIDVEFWQLYL